MKFKATHLKREKEILKSIRMKHLFIRCRDVSYGDGRLDRLVVSVEPSYAGQLIDMFHDGSCWYGIKIWKLERCIEEL